MREKFNVCTIVPILVGVIVFADLQLLCVQHPGLATDTVSGELYELPGV